MAPITPRTPDYEYSPLPLPPMTTQQGKGVVRTKTVHVDAGYVDPSLTEESQDPTLQQSGWTSTYLKKTTLLGFAVIFLCLLLGVIALAVVDAKQDGIANAKSSEHYLWTYGPTAVLVIVAALWNQTEFRVKDAMPWVLLQKGSTSASETLFIDYLTPGKHEALFTSLRRSHWPVAIAITNSFLITLLTVASTGLLVLQNTSFTITNCHLNVTDDFVTSFDSSMVGSAPVLATIAIQNGTIPLPPGTSRDAAFRSLLPPTSLSEVGNIGVEGQTSAFHAFLDCEVATLTSGNSLCADRQCHSLNVSLAIASPTCEIASYNLTTSCGWRFGAVSCDVSTSFGGACDTHPSDNDKNRLVFINGQMKQDLGREPGNGTGPLEVVATNTTMIVCEPKYNIANTYVEMDRVGNVKNVPDISRGTNHTQGFPAWDLVDGIVTATEAVGLSLDNTYSYSAAELFPWATFQTFFVNWINATHPGSDLRSPSVLQSHANEMFSMVSAQMAKQDLMRTSTDELLGLCHGTKDRLRVRGLSLYLMSVVLLLLILSTLGLLYIAPRQYVSRDPSSIGGLALVLSQSPALRSQLATFGSADLRTLKSGLSNSECQTIMTQRGQDRRLMVDLRPQENTERLDPASTSPQTPTITYWRPLSLRPVFKIIVIATLLLLVVILEVLYAVSQKQDGLAEVDPQHNERFAWVYVPAVVMLTTQTMVGMIAFSILVIFPYFRLRTQASNTRSDVLRNYVSETAVKCLWQALTARHVVVACTALATLLTPLLTIAVSGLYSAQTTTKDIMVTLSTRNQFNQSFTSRDLVSTDLGPITKASSNNIGLLLTQNFSFPLWTYDELAFPEAALELPVTMPSNSSMLTRSNVTVTLPAIRSELKCDFAESVPVNFTDTIGFFKTRKASIAAFEALGVYDDLNWRSPGSNSFGFFTACPFGDGRSMANTFCGAYGTSEVNWNAFTCTSQINELDVEVTLNAQTLSILAARPNESTLRFFSNQTLTPGNMSPFPSSMIPSLFGKANFGDGNKVAGYYEPVFQAVVFGLGHRGLLNDFPMHDYMNNEGFATMMDKLQHVHRTVTAQSAGLIRVSTNDNSALAQLPKVNATLTNPNVYRLRQSAVSTRILDGLLVAIALCIAVSFFLLDTRKVVPKNPASIAAAASLIAGKSHMLSDDVLPSGAQWMTDAELEAEKVWDDTRFRLGWWDCNGPSEQKSQGEYFKLDAIETKSA